MGKNKDSLAAMSGSDIGSSKARPVCVIPERGQVAENSPESAAAERSDVLQEDELGS